ncbi:MAG: hypothetical protein WAR37_02115 [Candidatus Microsaccharimonas sp.]
MVEYREEVDRLLRAYSEYKVLLKVEAGLSMERAKQKIIGDVDERLAADYENVKQKQQSLSDSMTFSNPFVWIMYKFEAYKDEAQPIRTIRDFRIHCSKDGYICTKRFRFINEQLAQRGQKTLLDSYYANDDLLNTLIKENSLQELVNDSTFIGLWQKHEFNTVNTRVAKWESY